MWASFLIKTNDKLHHLKKNKKLFGWKMSWNCKTYKIKKTDFEEKKQKNKYNPLVNVCKPVTIADFWINK